MSYPYPALLATLICLLLGWILKLKSSIRNLEGLLSAVSGPHSPSPKSNLGHALRGDRGVRDAAIREEGRPSHAGCRRLDSGGVPTWSID